VLQYRATNAGAQGHVPESEPPKNKNTKQNESPHGTKPQDTQQTARSSISCRNAPYLPLVPRSSNGGVRGFVHGSVHEK
jgi:hypothetical protein